ncbi:MAG TPA: hypothetical protein VFO10_02170 [Oligoflexus sp.]|uniref:hypothetical protein n=1 Tax=Oligoflexus sp. TaxID=1971216 RepID=UPI002D7F53E9|nr:hypothetical protein [Oligoflexus sp.]HET9236025.1 hypothetical protein [Oligoflexus sp.]
MRTLVFGPMIFLCLALGACQSGGGGGGSDGVSGNEGGSEPINPTEERAYKRAILKCYKTGGSRVVKIEGQLMCY